MKICIITPGYPDLGRPFFVFVERLVNEFADQGHQCVVIAPQSILQIVFRNTKKSSFHRFHRTEKGNIVEIYQPYYLSFSNYKIGNILKRFTHKLALKRVIKRLDDPPTLFYAHFWVSAFQIYRIALKAQIPLFVATGESEIHSFEYVSKTFLNNFTNYVSGVICVSEKSKLESINLNLSTNEKCITLNNAVDKNKFYVKDKEICRKKLGISEDVFLVIFVGGFIHRKGSLRVSNALQMLNDKNIESIFIGSGIDEPQYNRIFHSGPVENNKIIDYLNSADVFVLPTLREGCCNAIIEAMACGLPIISSNLSFNDDILNSKNSIRIDPNNIVKLAEAINMLKESPKIRTEMSSQSLKIASKLTIDKRALKIIDFIRNKLD